MPSTSYPGGLKLGLVTGLVSAGSFCWLLALQGHGHHPRCWALGGRTCAHPPPGLPRAADPVSGAGRPAGVGAAPARWQEAPPRHRSTGGRHPAGKSGPHPCGPAARAEAGGEVGPEPGKETDSAGWSHVGAGGAAGVNGLAAGFAGRGAGPWILTHQVHDSGVQGSVCTECGSHGCEGAPRVGVSGVRCQGAEGRSRGQDRPARRERGGSEPGSGACVPMLRPAGPPLPEAPVSVSPPVPAQPPPCAPSGGGPHSPPPPSDLVPAQRTLCRPIADGTARPAL